LGGNRAKVLLRVRDLDHFSLPIKICFDPTLAGRCLAACTFFVALFNQSPDGLEYAAGLYTKDATYLQRGAWQTVLSYQD